MAFEHLSANDGAVDVSRGIDADTLRTRMLGPGGLLVLDERDDLAGPRAADPNALVNAGQFVRAAVGSGFRVGDVDRVVGRDGDATRPSELPPLRDEAAALVEDLDAVVLAIAHEQPPLRIDRDRVRLAHLTRP